MNEAAKLLKARARAEALDLSPWTDIEFSAAGVSADGERYIRVPLDIATVLRAELIRLIDPRLTMKLEVIAVGAERMAKVSVDHEYFRLLEAA